MQMHSKKIFVGLYWEPMQSMYYLTWSGLEEVFGLSTAVFSFTVWWPETSFVEQNAVFMRGQQQQNFHTVNYKGRHGLSFSLQ